MEEFIMIFRNSYDTGVSIQSPEQVQNRIKEWQNWMENIPLRGKLVATNQIGFMGKTIKAGNAVADGSYTEVKKKNDWYLIVEASSIDEALEIAKGCPILKYGGYVEVRDVIKAIH
jgi:hypothetical protein